MTEKRLLEAELEKIKKRLNTMEIRVSLAQGWVGLLRKAYDALLYHGVNYQTLPEYKDDDTLTEAQDMPISLARNKIINWMSRMESGIEAAVRRKSFRLT
ncbi:MAG: hypothetical protein JJ891_06920 [Rhizobiaceae bacterium]|nr:hypothetical protein [Rhizobiaceae bacterium]